MPNPANHQPPSPDQIRDAREAQHLSRLELAGLLLDCTPAEIETARRLLNLEISIRYWESGAREPSPRYSDALIRALSLDR